MFSWLPLIINIISCDIHSELLDGLQLLKHYKIGRTECLRYSDIKNAKIFNQFVNFYSD